VETLLKPFAPPQLHNCNFASRHRRFWLSWCLQIVLQSGQAGRTWSFGALGSRRELAVVVSTKPLSAQALTRPPALTFVVWFHRCELHQLTSCLATLLHKLTQSFTLTIPRSSLNLFVSGRSSAQISRSSLLRCCSLLCQERLKYEGTCVRYRSFRPM
jgi:hypothetical protein